MEFIDPLFTGGEPGEFEALCREVRTLHPNRILKIGAGRNEGRRLLRLCEASMPFLDEAVAMIPSEGKEKGVKAMNPQGTLAGHLRFRLVDMEVFVDDAEGVIGASVADHYHGAFDFIFVDVEARAEVLQGIFDLFYPCLSRKGVMAFHFIVTRGDEPSFWASLKGDPPKDTRTEEFIGPDSKHGIGILRRGAKEENASEPLLRRGSTSGK